MQNQIKYIIALLLSIAICIGMLYALYIDLNYFLTRKEGGAEILKVSDVRASKPFYLQLRYHNEFDNKVVECNINLDAHDTQVVIEKYKQKNKLDIYYAKNYPTKIYVEGINSPRLLIIVVEILMLMILLFSIYSCIKSLVR